MATSTNIPNSWKDCSEAVVLLAELRKLSDLYTVGIKTLIDDIGKHAGKDVEKVIAMTKELDDVTRCLVRDKITYKSAVSIPQSYHAYNFPGLDNIVRDISTLKEKALLKRLLNLESPEEKISCIGIHGYTLEKHIKTGCKVEKLVVLVGGHFVDGETINLNVSKDTIRNSTIIMLDSSVDIFNLDDIAISATRRDQDPCGNQIVFVSVKKPLKN